jgi:hypothetical protein
VASVGAAVIARVIHEAGREDVVARHAVGLSIEEAEHDARIVAAGSAGDREELRRARVIARHVGAEHIQSRELEASERVVRGTQLLEHGDAARGIARAEQAPEVHDGEPAARLCRPRIAAAREERRRFGLVDRNALAGAKCVGEVRARVERAELARAVEERRGLGLVLGSAVTAGRHHAEVRTRDAVVCGAALRIQDRGCRAVLRDALAVPRHRTEHVTAVDVAAIALLATPSAVAKRAEKRRVDRRSRAASLRDDQRRRTHADVQRTVLVTAHEVDEGSELRDGSDPRRDQRGTRCGRVLVIESPGSARFESGAGRADVRALDEVSRALALADELRRGEQVAGRRPATDDRDVSVQ